MTGILLTKSSTPIIGWVAEILGIIMNGIFNLLDFISIPNVGISIILFTIVVYLLLLPLTIKQQKFSKLSAKMNPELQAIQAKYRGKKDNESAMQMQAETQAVYAKYGVSPSGSCVQLLIQMPILFALYQVIYRMPAYVSKIGNAFGILADEIIGKDLVGKVKELAQAAQYTKNFDLNEKNAIIDTLNSMNFTELQSFAETNNLSNLETINLIEKYNNFFGLNIANSPSAIIGNAIKVGAWGMVIAAIMIPVLSAVTQWINVKLMPQNNQSSSNQNEMANTMATSMKTMNMVMPVMSAIFCYTLPAGMGIYWIAGSVVRSIQQVVINKHIDKMDLNEVIEKNKEKSQKKIAKIKANQEKMQMYANMNTRGINNTYAQKADAASKISDIDVSATTNRTAKPGSMLEKANMVKEFNERNNK